MFRSVYKTPCVIISKNSTRLHSWNSNTGIYFIAFSLRANRCIGHLAEAEIWRLPGQTILPKIFRPLNYIVPQPMRVSIFIFISRGRVQLRPLFPTHLRPTTPIRVKRPAFLQRVAMLQYCLSATQRSNDARKSTGVLIATQCVCTVSPAGEPKYVRTLVNSLIPDPEARKTHYF